MLISCAPWQERRRVGSELKKTISLNGWTLKKGWFSFNAFKDLWKRFKWRHQNTINRKRERFIFVVGAAFLAHTTRVHKHVWYNIFYGTISYYTKPTNMKVNVFIVSTDKVSYSVMNLFLGGEITHYDDVIMSGMASQTTSFTIVYSTVYSDVEQRKHQSPASLAFVREFTGDRWIPRTNGQ